MTEDTTTKALARELEEAEAEAAALRAQMAGEPDSLPLTWCKHCVAEVKPEGKGRCPRCQTFLRLNFARRTHPVNVLRREQLLAQYVRDYAPTTTHLRGMCEDLAAIREQLEGRKADGSANHQRLVQLSQLLGTALEESRASRVASPPNDFANLSDDDLINKFTAMLREHIAQRDHKMVVAPAGLSSEASAMPAGNAEVPTPAPAPEPICKFCMRPCIGKAHELYPLFHALDEEEIWRRRAALREADAREFELRRQYGLPPPRWD